MIDFKEIIERARKVHGDKYEYDKSTYTRMYRKMKIICPEHGEFWQTPTKHISCRHGCPKCHGLYRTTEEFIEKARKIHGDKYDYSKVNYVDSHTKVCIICTEHGEFWMTPHDHLQHNGCPKCKFKKIGNIKRSNTEEFIEKAKQIWGDKYDYSKVKYEKSNKKVCIICLLHGEFWVTPANHLKGRGCPKCVGKNRTTEEIIEEAKKTHGDKYDYSKVEYVNNTTKICIICPEHGEFWQLPYSHIVMKYGCPSCSMSHLENKISRLLKENNISNVYETNINGLLGRQSADFYLPDHNIVIECQGGQHFYPGFNRNNIKKATEIHNNVRVRDIKKNKKCKDNNINILYFTDINDLPNDIFTNKKYKGIYTNDNFFMEESKLLEFIIQNKIS